LTAARPSRGVGQLRGRLPSSPCAAGRSSRWLPPRRWWVRTVVGRNGGIGAGLPGPVPLPL